MNKKLITVAISAAISSIAMTAQADVKVYGRVQAEVAHVKDKIAKTAYTDVADYGGGTLGVSADEDLGGGMKGIGKIEFVTNTAGDSCGTQTLPAPAAGATTGQCTSEGIAAKGDREQFVGLESGFGTLRLGRVNTPYKLTGAAIDPFITTALEARGNGGMSPAPGGFATVNPLNTHKSGYVNNGIVYNSPKFAGIGADVYYSPDSKDNTRGDISAAVTWTGGPASAFVALNRDAHANGNTAVMQNYNATALKVGGQFKFGAAGSLAAEYETLKSGSNLPGSKENVLFVGYQMPFGSWTAIVQGAVGNDNANNKNKSTYLAAGARYNFSKTFSSYGGLRMTKVKNTVNVVDQQAVTIGLRKDF